MEYDTNIEQPCGVEIKMADGVFIKQMVIKRAFTLVPQHSHTYDHTSMIAAGAVRVWRDGKIDRDYLAPTGIMIKAGVKHTFQSLADETIIYCIHNVARAGDIEIDEYHVLEELA